MQYLGFVYLRFRFNLTSCFYLETLSVSKHVGSGVTLQSVTSNSDSTITSYVTLDKLLPPSEPQYL